MSIFRRLIGFLMILVGIVGLIITGATAFFAGQAIDAVAAGLNSTVDLLDNTVGTTTASLENVKATLSETTATLTTVSSATGNMATTLFDTQPLLEQVTTMTTDTVPNSLDAVNAAIPNLAGIAATIDTTLTQLSNLQIARTIEAGPFSVPLNFDLGIDYAPREPFDDAVLTVGDSLIPVPDQLRMLESNLNTTVENLGNIGSDIEALSGNISGINRTVEQYIPLLDQYIALLDQITGSLESARTQLNANLGTAKWLIVGLSVWFALYQIMPIYIGYRMLSDQVVEGSIEERLEEEREEMEEQLEEMEEQMAEAAEKSAGAADDTAMSSS